MQAKMFWQALVSFVGLASAQFISNCPSTQDASNICYAVNVPTDTASSGTGDIFFQIKGSTSRAWIGLGQGTGMAGANIFVIYPNQNGDNVTLSPRSGAGHFEPDFNSGAQVTLLGGSGISSGVMLANIKCSNCKNWAGGSMSFTDSSSKWIWASAPGQNAVKSDSASAEIAMHDENGELTFDLTKAVSTSSTDPNNPFSNITTTSVSGGDPSGSPGGEGEGGAPGSSSTSSSYVDLGVLDMLAKVRTAHASLLSLAFLFFFPLGAILVRVASFKQTIWAHAATQAFSYALAIAGMGMGIWMAQTVDRLNSYHAIIGLVTVSALIFQAPLGLLHHRSYKSKGRRTLASYAHIWWGRALMVLGAINGAFGLTLAGNSRDGLIAYGTLAGVIYVGYFVVVLLTGWGKRGTARSEKAPGTDSH